MGYPSFYRHLKVYPLNILPLFCKRRTLKVPELMLSNHPYVKNLIAGNRACSFQFAYQFYPFMLKRRFHIMRQFHSRLERSNGVLIVCATK